MAIFAVPAGFAHAETRVGGYINSYEEWNSAGSPYLLTSHVTVTDGATLSIGPGVVVQVAAESKTEDIGFDPALFITGGSLTISGTVDKHVSMNGVGGIFVSAGDIHNGSADIKYADLSEGTRISFDDSFGSIASTTIRGADMGIYSKDSDISIWGSSIENNSVGVYVQPHKVFLLGDVRYRARGSFGTGGIGNALSLAPDLFASSSVDIHDSIFLGNTDRAIMNNSELTVNAQSNWWGSPNGPTTVGDNSVRGDVVYAPWLDAPPVAEPVVAVTPCCSSVLFIPGMEGSRLYSTILNLNAPLLSRATTTDQLWEPMINSDVVKLKLDSNGSSTDPAIFAGGPIDKALGFVDIYDGFMRSLDEIVKTGKISEWRAFGYDWRKPIDGVVLGDQKRSTTTENLIHTVEDLASKSKTGKVSIVAHSNGGLVTKYLVKTLAGMGEATLIDSVISVAVPYLGTPAAIPALLHGDGQAILGGIIASGANMRALGSNMPSAYSLLPSREFFAKYFGPTIVYASTTVDSFDKQSAFIADIVNMRKKPSIKDLNTPIKGNQLLMMAADVLHGVLDPFVWPATIARWAIVGWNNDKTPIGIKYPAGKYKVITDPYGDGTVLANSASDNSSEIVPVDLKTQSTLDGRDINHVNILESSTTKSAVASIVTNPSGLGSTSYNYNPAEHNTMVQGELSKLPGVTVGNMDWNALEAAYEANRKEITVSTHSPVKLHIYDSHGNHTGEIPLPPEVTSQVEEGLYRFSETKIPGSTFDVHSCIDDANNDCETYISLPDNGETYNIVVEGAGVGTFKLDIERTRATTTIETVEWSDVPTTPLTVATTTLVSDARFGIPVSNLASSTGPLKLDLNGDGSSDSTFMPGKVKDSSARLGLMKSLLSAFADRHKHIKFKDMKLVEKAAFKALIEAFLKKFGRN